MHTSKECLSSSDWKENFDEDGKWNQQENSERGRVKHRGWNLSFLPDLFYILQIQIVHGERRKGGRHRKSGGNELKWANPVGILEEKERIRE